MNTTVSKPWFGVLLAAAAIPTTAYVALVLSLTLRCGWDYGGLMAFLIGIMALAGIGFAIVPSTIILALWRGEFPLRGWRFVCVALAIGAGIFGVQPVLHGLSDPTFCNISL